GRRSAQAVRAAHGDGCRALLLASTRPGGRGSPLRDPLSLGTANCGAVAPGATWVHGAAVCPRGRRGSPQGRARMNPPIPIHDSRATEALWRELRLDPHALRQLRTRFFKKFQGRDRSLEVVPVELREDMAERIDFHP